MAWISGCARLAASAAASRPGRCAGWAATSKHQTAERHDPFEPWWPGCHPPQTRQPQTTTCCEQAQQAIRATPKGNGGSALLSGAALPPRSPASAGRPSNRRLAGRFPGRAASVLASLKPAYGRFVIGLAQGFHALDHSGGGRIDSPSAVVLRPRPKPNRCTPPPPRLATQGGSHVGGVAAAAANRPLTAAAAASRTVEAVAMSTRSKLSLRFVGQARSGCR